MKNNKTKLKLALMKTKIHRSILIALFALTLSNKTFAESKTAGQFNFDEDYQGDEMPNKDVASVYDPFEKFNRKIFAFNEVADKTIALPVAKQYRKFVPISVRNSIHNFINNISSPFSTINSLAQGDTGNAMASFSSFLINSTIGIGGLFDVAGNKKIKYHKEDFGQTLGKYGSGSGAYLIIPFIGPSNVRDFSGVVVNRMVDPLSFDSFNIAGDKNLISNEVQISLFLAGGIDAREGLIEIIDDVRQNSLDAYATLRSAYSQRRNSLILNK
jgi:phospholipid-binding lipoprotein MlaA